MKTFVKTLSAVAVLTAMNLVHLGSPWNAALTFKKKYRSSRKP